MHNYGWGDDQKTFLVIQVNGSWGLQDYNQVAEETFSMMKSVSHPVDLLVDMRHSPPPPLRIVEVAGRLMQQRPANHRYTIVISERWLWRKLVHSVLSIFEPGRDRGEIMFVASVDDAYQIIARSTV